MVNYCDLWLILEWWRFNLPGIWVILIRKFANDGAPKRFGASLDFGWVVGWAASLINLLSFATHGNICQQPNKMLGHVSPTGNLTWFAWERTFQIGTCCWSFSLDMEWSCKLSLVGTSYQRLQSPFWLVSDVSGSMNGRRNPIHEDVIGCICGKHQDRSQNRTCDSRGFT